MSDEQKSDAPLSSGLGSCMYCGRHWDVCSHENIPCAVNKAMFPLCTRCFAKLPAYKIKYYCLRLVEEWMRLMPLQRDEHIRDLGYAECWVDIAKKEPDTEGDEG